MASLDQSFGNLKPSAFIEFKVKPVMIYPEYPLITSPGHVIVQAHE
jgi:hypothetical protein